MSRKYPHLILNVFYALGNHDLPTYWYSKRRLCNFAHILGEHNYNISKDRIILHFFHILSPSWVIMIWKAMITETWRSTEPNRSKNIVPLKNLSSFPTMPLLFLSSTGSRIGSPETIKVHGPIPQLLFLYLSKFDHDLRFPLRS